MSTYKIDKRLKAPICSDLMPVIDIFHNNWFTLKKRGEYYTIEYNEPQVVVLPVVDNKSIIMVSVKRPVIADCPLELPAGGANSNESPVQAASREFFEETGIYIHNLNRFKLMPTMSILPNRFPVMPWIYMIDVSQKEYELRLEHDSEIENVHVFTFEETIKKIVDGEIYVSLPLSIISKYIFTRFNQMFNEK